MAEPAVVVADVVVVVVVVVVAASASEVSTRRVAIIDAKLCLIF